MTDKLTKLYPVVSISREELVNVLSEVYGCSDMDLLTEFAKTLSDLDMQEIADTMSHIIGDGISISEIIEDIVSYDLYKRLPGEILRGDFDGDM